MDDRDILTHAIQIVKAAQKRGVVLRLLGAVACAIHCPTYSFVQKKARPHFKDLDFVGLYRESDAIRKIFKGWGYEQDVEMAVLYGRSRLIFTRPQDGLCADVFLDRLHFSHVVPVADRLKVDCPTIPLAELLLTKMQIVQLNERDVVDTLMLVREHPVDSGDEETINVARIAALCARDWGLWRTVTINLRKVADLAQRYDWLSDADRAVVGERIDQLGRALDAAPKSTAWKLRNRIGERVKWYDKVSEVRR